MGADCESAWDLIPSDEQPGLLVIGIPVPFLP